VGEAHIPKLSLKNIRSPDAGGEKGQYKGSKEIACFTTSQKTPEKKKKMRGRDNSP